MSDKATDTQKEVGDSTPVEYREEVVVVKQPQQNRFKRHCARFWWLHLIIFIVITIVVVLITIFVAVPKIAQSRLNSATLTIDSIVVSKSESNSYNMAINSTIHADDSVKATIAPFNGSMYLEDLEPHTPFATIEFPTTYAETVQVVNVSQLITIENMDAFTTFNTWLLANKTVRVTVDGDTTIRVRGISRDYGVTFKKTVELAGLDNFSGLNVTSATITVLPDANGDNFKGFVNVPNHSILTLDIGNATFSTMFNGTDLGPTHLDNMILYPGPNNITMHASQKQLPVLTAIKEQPYCQSGIMPFIMTGINVTNNGENLTYFGESLAAVSQTVQINIGDILQRDLNITRNCSASAA